MPDILTAILTASWLGILTSISPCPLASNICAISYLSKDIRSKKKVLLSSVLYILGRMFTYFVIGIFLISTLLSIIDIAVFLQDTINIIIGPILLITGIILLFIKRFSFSIGGDFINKLQEKIKSKGIIGSFILGVLFALAFCPITAAIFFGSLIPLALKYQSGFIFPLFYGIGTGLPVAIFAILIAFSIAFVSKFFNKISFFEKIFRLISSIIFIIIGIYFILLFFNLNILDIFQF